MAEILISGYYGFNNIGDEAILRTVIDSAEAALPGSHITVLSHDPADTEAKYGVSAVPRMNLRAILKAVRRCELLISGGGSLLQDVTSRVSILYYLFIILLGILFHKRVFIYSQGIGPIRGRFNRKLTALLLRRVDAVAVRDERSAAFLRELGIPAEKLTLSADPVLRLPKADLAGGREILARAGVERREGRRLIGWAVKADPTNPAFLDETEKAIRLLSEMPDTDVVLIPFYHAEDILPIRELSRRLGDRAHYVTEKLLSEEMLSLMGNLDLLVGVRLHSLIYAAVMGVPMVGLSYDPKIDAFLASVGLAPLSSTGDFTAEGFLAGYAAAAGKADPEKVAALSRRLRENDALLRQVAAGQTAGGEGRVGGIIGSVMLITVAAKMLGILRESFQAGAFGAADAFYAAFNKTIYLYTTIAYALCVAAVPTMTKALSRDKRQGARTANGLLTLTLLGSLLAMGGWIALTLPAGLANFWGGAEAAGYTRLMALSLPIIVAAYMMVALMQALDHYALQGSMSLPYSLCLILYLLIFGNRLPLWSYVLVVSLGWVVQFAMCLPYVRREKWRYRPVLELRADYVGGFVKTAFVTVVTNSMYLFCYLLDASRAAGLGEGVTTAFYYADKLFTPLTTTFIYSISAVMFPRLNRAYTSAGKSDYLRYVWGLLSGTLVIVFPVCALLLVFGGQILQVLFESGSFTAENTAETASIFRMYALGMAGFSAIDILSKAFFAMDKRAVPLAVSLGVVASTWGLNLAFGLSGAMLALTTAGSLTLGAGITAVILFRGEKLADLRDMGKSLVASLLMGLAAWGLRSLFVSGLEGKVVMVMKCGLIGVVALAVYVAAAWLLKLEALRNVVKR